MSLDYDQKLSDRREKLRLFIYGAAIGGAVFWIGGFGSGEDSDPWGLCGVGLGAVTGLMGTYRFFLDPSILHRHTHNLKTTNVSIRKVHDRTGGKFLAVGAILVVQSSMTVFVAFGPTVFSEWPWFRSASLLSLITCLAPFAALWCVRDRRNNDMTGISIAYGIFCVPILVVLIEQQIAAHRLTSDECDFHRFALQIEHGIAFSVVKQLLVNQLQAAANEKQDAGN